MIDQAGDYDIQKVPSVEPPDETPQPDVPKILPRQLSVVQSDTISGNASAISHGWMPKLTGATTDFIDGTGEWDTVKDSDLSLSDITTNNASTSNHGFLLKLTGSTSNFLRADGTWAAPGSSPTFKFAVDNRGFATASGTQNVAHGLGATPTYVRIESVLYVGSGVSICHGSYDGTNTRSVTAWINANDAANDGESVQSSTLIINHKESGTLRQEATVTVDDTNVILAWTRAGTTSAATMRFHITVW